MKKAGKPALILLALLLVSVAVGLGAGLASGHPGLALIYGLLTGLGLISAYAILAWLFGWSRLKWDDATAIWYLLP